SRTDDLLTSIRCQSASLERGMLARLPKNDTRPALERQLQVHARRGEIDQSATVIDGEVLVRTLLELRELGGITPRDPARCMHRDGVEDALHAVLVLEAKRDHLELQRTDGSENQIVVPQRPEKLRRA